MNLDDHQPDDVLSDDVLGPPPPVPAPQPFQPESPTTHQLRSGVPVWHLSRPVLPLVSIRLIFAGGSASDPPDQHGLATLTDEVMVHGAGDRDAATFAAYTERRAIDLGILTGASSTIVYADTHVDRLQEALALLADVVLRPRLAASDLERVRTLQVGDLRQSLDDPRSIAPWVSARLYYGADHPFAHPEIGTLTGLNGITPTELRASWRQRFTAARAHFVIVGATSAEPLVDALEAHFGTLPAGDPEPVIPPPRGVSGGPRRVFIDNPGATQSALRVVLPGWSAHDPAHLAGDLTATILGGTYTSRLNQLMREEKGYTYSARASANPGRSFGTVVASAAVERDATAEGLTDMLSVLRLEAGPFTEEELIKAQAASRTALISAMEGCARVSGSLVRLSRLQLPPDTLAHVEAAEAAVTVPQLMAGWQHRMDLSGALIIVVGDLSEIQSSVEAALPGPWEVVPAVPPAWLLG